MTVSKNVILICLDTMREDVAYHAGLKRLDRLRASGVTFWNAVASSPLTPISHASVFTGLQPYEHGLRHLLREQLTTSKPTLAELFTLAGYETGAIVSCPGLNRWYGLDRGFAYYDDEVPPLPDGRDPVKVGDVKIRGTALKRAPLVVERTLAWLGPRRSGPFFLFAHFFDTHWPYEPPEWFAPAGANPYEGEAHYVDHYLGKLLDQIEAWGLLQNTLIVLFSDHGEDLAGWYANDHAGPELGHPEENGHGCLLFDATQMVPLVIVGPGMIPSGASFASQVRLIDIFPTIVEIIGLDDPVTRAGESLTCFFKGNGNHRLAYCETFYREEQALLSGGVPGLGPWHALRIDNRYKIIFDVNSTSISVYDLANDRSEHQPLSFNGMMP
jgi:arylsulfatase